MLSKFFYFLPYEKSQSMFIQQKSPLRHEKVKGGTGYSMCMLESPGDINNIPQHIVKKSK